MTAAFSGASPFSCAVPRIAGSVARLCLCLCLCLVLICALGAEVHAAARPNVVLILADDLGFSDITPYGSEIRTPTLASLAEQGIRFSNYHTAASCAPSRAMLLTGVDNHRNGVPNIPEALPPEQAAHDHYRGVLSHNVVTVASLLRDAGYHTYMAGKWHLGHTQDLLPGRRGFEQAVAMADTGSDNWEQKPYLPIYDKANWYENGAELQLPDDYYSSEYLVNRLIEFIGDSADDRPFFAYLPFMAVHIPVQAPREFTDRYADTYTVGWTEIRERRQQAVQALGLIRAGAPMVTMSTTDNWDALSADAQRYNARRMAVYAGMVEAMDFHMGRLIEHLSSTGELDNTVFVFTSDNGAEASGATDPTAWYMDWALRGRGYSVDYETLGERGSFNTIGASFASAASAPLSYYKFYAGEGGLRVPLIVAGAGIEPSQAVTNAFSYVTDIAPTILELADVPVPDGQYQGRSVERMVGRSLMPLIRGEVERVYGPEDPVGYEVAGNAALFAGDYKIVRNRGPVGDNAWHLFNISVDPGETDDLAGREPERLQRMLKLYAAYEEQNGVLPVPDGYVQTRQVALNGIRDRLGVPAPVAALGLLLVLLTMVAAAVLSVRRLRRNRPA